MLYKPVFDQLADQLHKVHGDLTFEFGPIKDGRREFVILADGKKEAFPSVEILYAAKPELPKWKVTKFRPRREPMSVELNGRTVRPEDVRYVLGRWKGDEKVSILLFFKDLTSANKGSFSSVGFLMLDQALGEYDVETKVGAIDFLGPDSKHYDSSRPLSELAEHFDELLARKN